MSILAAIPVIGNVIDRIFGVVDKVVPDVNLREKIKQEIAVSTMTMDHEEMQGLVDARAKILAAEMASGGPGAKWRPHLMYIFMAILVNNFIVAPWGNYAVAIAASLWKFTVPGQLPYLTMPFEGWLLLILGTTGYVLGRSGEKMIERVLEMRMGK